MEGIWPMKNQSHIPQRLSSVTDGEGSDLQLADPGSSAKMAVR